MIRGVVCGLLVLATLGEGGGSPSSIVIWHGGVVVLALLLLLGPGQREPRYRTLPADLALALALFLALFVVGVARAPYGYAALLTGLELASCVVLALAAIAAGPQLLGSLRTWLLGAGAIQSGYVLYQWIVLDTRRPAGTFLTPNHLALWCVAALLLGLSGWPRQVGALVKVANGLALAGLGVSLSLTGSRGALVGLAAGGVSLAALRWSHWTRRERTAVLSLLLVGLAAGGLRLGQRLADSDPFRYHRLQIWRASLGVLTENPLWGCGPGQFATAAANWSFPDGDPPLRFDRTFFTTHSDPLRLPCELGLPAALAALVVLALAWRKGVARRRCGPWPAVADGAFAALAAIGAHGVFDNPSDWPAVYLLASVLAGALLFPPAVLVPRIALGLRLIAAFGVLWVYLALDVTSFAAWSQVRDLPRGRLDPSGAARLARALEFNPIHPDLWRRQAEHLAGDGSDWDLEGYAAARQAAERAVRLAPTDARTWQGLAEIEARACRTLLHDESTRARSAEDYAQAQERDRHNPFLAIDLAKLLIDTGDIAGARRAAERALDLEPQSVLPRLLLADALIEGGTAGGASRAVALLDEAQELAVRGAAAAGNNAYSRELLRLDPAIAARIRGDRKGTVD